MRIFVMGINYAPERTSVAPFTTGLCEHLANRGHDVTVVTAFPYYPEWRVWDRYRGRLYQREHINNVRVQRVWHFVPSRGSSLIQRLTHDLSFTLSALFAGLFAGKFDLIYCSCPPPTLALVAYVLAKVRGKPYVIKLTDLASDAALATGILKEGLAVRVARAIEGFVYRKADTVVCICQGFIEKLAVRGIQWEKLRLISDWADTRTISPLSDVTSFRKANDLPNDGFLAIHTGNMGKKQDLMNVVRAAELSKDVKDLIWVLVGLGEDRSLIEEAVRQRDLKNVRLLALQPVETLAEMFSSADALILNQKAAVVDSVIPSKLLTYMAAGRPVLAAVNEESQAARAVREARCGVVARPEDPKALVEAAMVLRNDSALRNRLGTDGRKYAEQHFTKEKILQEYDALFDHWANEEKRDAKVPKEATLTR